MVSVQATTIPLKAVSQVSAERWIPLNPTLWPHHCLPQLLKRAAPFPLSAEHVYGFYFCRNAVWHAVEALGIREQHVLVPAYHHGVEIAALVAANVRPVFAAVDRNMRLDLDDLRRKVRSQKRLGAIYVIHYLGFPEALDDLVSISHAAGIPMIEDCALSLLASHKGAPVGSHGDAALFSFHKALPTPNGGALVLKGGRRPFHVRVRVPGFASTLSHASNSMLANLAMRWGPRGHRMRTKLRAVGSYVRHRGRIPVRPMGDGVFDSKEADLGMSWLTRVILSRLDYEVIARTRRSNYLLLLSMLRDMIEPVFSDLPPGSSPLFFPVRCSNPPRLVQALKERGVESIHFWSKGHPLCDLNHFPEVAELRRTIVEIPCHQDLGPEDIFYIASCVRECIPRC